MTVSLAAEPATSTSDSARASTSTRWWMWGLLPAFIIHDGEEALYILLHHGSQQFGRWETPVQSLAGIAAEFTLGWMLTLAAVRAARPGLAMRLYAGLLAGWTLHGVAHLVDGLTHDGYAFGAVTALPACVAYGTVTLRRIYADRLLSRGWLLVAAVGGVAAALPLIYAAHRYGWLIA
jgi:Protein of unknown function with HXXEE motif